MSLLDELQAESEAIPPSQRSQIDIFVDTLTGKDRADFDAWLAAPKDTSAMYRVLKRRGLPVAGSTFRNWVKDQCR